MYISKPVKTTVKAALAEFKNHKIVWATYSRLGGQKGYVMARLAEKGNQS